MKVVNEKLDAFYKRHRVRNRIGDLRWGNVVNRQRETLAFPELKGVQIKAAAVRALIPFAAELATELDKGDEPATQACRSIDHVCKSMCPRVISRRLATLMPRRRGICKTIAAARRNRIRAPTCRMPDRLMHQAPRSVPLAAEVHPPAA